MTPKRAYILGGYQTDFERNWSKERKHISAIMREAFEEGIVSTELDPGDIKAAYIGNFAGELYAQQGLLGAFLPEFDSRLTGIPTMRIESACASGANAVLAGMTAIQAGLCDLVCILGVEQMKTVEASKGSSFLGTAAWYEREAAGIDFPFPKLFATLADEYDRRYTLDTRHLAMISAKNYSNAKRNPNAQTRTWYMSEEHAGTISDHNPVLWGFLKVSDCSQISDGAVSLFLSSQEYAEQYAKKHTMNIADLPYIQGWGCTTAPFEFSVKLAQSKNDDYILPYTRKAILDAFTRAGIENCWDLDLIETHDCFTSSEYMAIDHFGITNPGESWKALEEGIVQLDGKLPVNPSGGLIGVGHPVGATGVRQVLDVVKQVTGKAGEYQVEHARRAATLNLGGSATLNIAFVIGKSE